MRYSPFFILILVASIKCFAWEEDPRLEEYNKRTQYLIKLGNMQVEERDPDVIELLNLIHEERKKLEIGMSDHEKNE